MQKAFQPLDKDEGYRSCLAQKKAHQRTVSISFDVIQSWIQNHLFPADVRRAEQSLVLHEQLFCPHSILE